MKKVITLLAILTISIFYSCKAQESYINCGHKKLTIKKFVTDSMFSYNNRYVKYEAVKSIKESKFPVEIRIYSTGTYNNMFDFVMLQATADSIFITNKRIQISGKLSVPKYEVVQRGDGYTVNVATRKIKKSENTYYNFFSQLISNHLFDVKGSNSTENYKKDPAKDFNHPNSKCEFEIKVNGKFRNFEYNSNANFIDPDSIRAKYIYNLKTILFKKLELNENN